MFRDATEETAKEKALKIYYLPEESFGYKLSKTNDKNTLKELWLLAVQKDNSRVVGLVLAQAKTNGISLQY